MTTFSMVQTHGWGLSDVEEMVPFERDTYVDMIIDEMGKKEGVQVG
jgi:hypothetical protein